MFNNILRGLIFIFIALSAPQSVACVGACELTRVCYSLSRIDYKQCSSERPFLDRGNDSRTNLLYLYQVATVGKIKPQPWGHLAYYSRYWPEIDPSDSSKLNLAQSKFSAESNKIEEENSKTDQRIENERSKKESGRYLKLLSDITGRNMSTFVLPNGLDYRTLDGDSCGSNNLEIASMFLERILTLKVDSSEKSKLAELRHKVLAICSSVDAQASSSLVRELGAVKGTSLLSSYTQYLAAITLFYSAQPSEARCLFEELENSDDPWLAELATYLNIRVSLVEATKEWGGYSDSKSVDLNAVAEAQTRIERYLKLYPNGRFAKSARALLRRVDYLKGDTPSLENRLYDLFENALRSRLNESEVEPIINEIDRLSSYIKGLPPYHHPLIATAGILAKIRLPREGEPPRNSGQYRKMLELTLGELSTHEKQFESYNSIHLYPYTKALILHELNRDNEALALLTNEVSEGPLKESILILKARVYEKSGDLKSARVIWRDLRSHIDPLMQDGMIPIETSLAINYLLDNDLISLFADQNGVNAPGLSDVIFSYLATIDEIKAILANEKISNGVKRQARQATLARLLVTKNYPEFQAIYSLSKYSSDPFNQVAPFVDLLQKNPKDPVALTEIGSFLITQNEILGHLTPCSLAGSIQDEIMKNGRNDRIFSYRNTDQPLSYFTEAITQFKQTKNDLMEAKALHHTIYCFKSGVHKESCQWKDISAVPESERRTWFRRVKSLKDNKWTRDVKHYY